jgi:hypothetical protein
MRVGLLALAAVIVLIVAPSPAVAGSYQVDFDFDTPWAGDYAPGWENTAYRHGTAPTGKMMEQVAGGLAGSSALRLIADSTPQDWMWWAAVNPIDVNPIAMKKQYDPWVSVYYFDEGWATGANLQKTGQLFAVPSWVNPYISGSEDWTDVQFGARFNQAPPADNYYYVAAGESSPGWQDTGVSRQNGGWVQLKMQLSSADGKIHFFIDGTEVGQSYRDDYEDLLGPGLYIMFDDPLGAWDENPSVVYDNFSYGSNFVPLPGAAGLGLVGLLGLGLARRIRRRRRMA